MKRLSPDFLTREHPSYSTYNHIKKRCNNPNDPDYHLYGGRGIKVCDRWMKGFLNFLEDMGEKPSPEHSIERLDNNKGYSPDNCTWILLRDQAKNKRVRTYCFKGHLLNKDNIRRGTKSKCLECYRKYQREWQRKAYKRKRIEVRYE